MASPALQSIVSALDHASRIAPRESSSIKKFTEDHTFAAPGAAAAAAPRDVTLADIVSQLNAATGGPEAEVKDGRVPLPQNVGILPPFDEASAVQNYGHLVEISSLAALYTAIYNANVRTKRGHPEPYNITIASEAAQAFADIANASYQAMTQPLAGFYSVSSATQSTFTQNISKTNIHLEFLTELFKGYSLTKPALMQLDGILTKFVASLKTISVETQSSSNTIDHTLRINQVLRLNISGDEANPIWVFQPRTRLIYMHIDASSYKWASNKVDHQSSEFNMRYVVVDCDLNVNKYLAAKPKLDTIFQTLTGMNLREYGEKISAPPVREDK